DIIDRGGAFAFIERADDVLGVYAPLVEVNADSYIDTSVVIGVNYKYRVKLNDLESSVLIVEDNSALVPPYYVAEPIGSAVFTVANETIVIPWTDDILIPIIEISNLRKTKYSRTKLSTG